MCTSTTKSTRTRPFVRSAAMTPLVPKAVESLARVKNRTEWQAKKLRHYFALLLHFISRGLQSKLSQYIWWLSFTIILITKRQPDPNALQPPEGTRTRPFVRFAAMARLI